MIRSAVMMAAATLMTFTGCNQHNNEATDVTVTDTSVRAQRRAYDGAPPVVGHESHQATCTTCHTDTGMMVPNLGFAPALPHGRDSIVADTANCRQCHLFKTSDELFVDSTFVGAPQVISGGTRLYPGAPPVMPHPLFMRENCTSCHSGPSARPEIICSHPDRANCMQCHVQHNEFASLSWPL